MASALRISEAASLAIHSAGLLASDPERARSTRTIAATFRVSEAHLAKVLGKMVKVGLLESTRGPKGGFRLARASDQITLLEVYETTEGPLEPVGCLFGLDGCTGLNCILGRVLADANASLYRYLETTTAADIAEIFREDRFRAGEQDPSIR